MLRQEKKQQLIDTIKGNRIDHRKTYANCKIDNCINRSIPTHTHRHTRTRSHMHIHIYNPIADKDGQYRLNISFFCFQFTFCWPIHSLLSFLCFALHRLAVIVLLCLLLLYLSMTRSRLSPVLRPPISPGCPFGCWDGELRLGLWRRSATASASVSA